MKVKENDNKKAFCIAAIASLIAGVGLLIIYIIKGIYPFGSRNISYYDMAQGFVPLYYRTYDILHGTKDLFWEWQSGFGVYTVDTVGNYVFSPFNLFFLFVKRNQILESMSIFLLIKICACAASMTFYSKKKWSNLEDIWHILFGISYCGCGYVIQYYSAIHFLDIVALFPIIMYFTDKLLEQKKIKGFILSVAIGFIMNLYIMYQIMIFILLYSAVKLITDCRTKRKERITTIGFGVIVALCLSSVIVVPNIVALLNSSRLEVAKEIADTHEIWKLVDQYFGNKIMMLYGCGFPAAICIVTFICKKKERKSFIPWLVLLGMMILPIWFEYINEAWHPGGYVEFPIRYGFIISYLFLYLAGRFLNSGWIISDVTCDKTEKIRHYGRIIGVAFIPFVAFALYTFTKGYQEYGCRDSNAYAPYSSIIVMLLFIFSIFLLTMKRKYVPMLCGALIIGQYMLGWFGLLAPTNMYSPECTDSIVKNGELVHSLINDDTDNNIERIKDVTNSLNANYPFIVEKAAISSWTYGGKESTQNVLNKLGYSIHYTRILDNGGTVFTDSLFAIKQRITFDNRSNYLYDVITQNGKYYLAEAKNSYPFGLVISKENGNLHFDEEITAFDMQNSLFKEISDKNNELIVQYEVSEVSKENIHLDNGYYQYECEIPVEDKGIIYLESIDENILLMLTVNDEILVIPDLENEDNNIYPGFFLNGLIECGYFDSETVHCVITSSQPIESNVTFGVLNVDLLIADIEKQNQIQRDVNTGKQSLEIVLNNEGENNLLLPLQFDKSIYAEVNGKTVETMAAVNNTFLMLPLENGQNRIIVKFRPVEIGKGIVLSIIGIMLFVLLLWKENLILENRVIGLIAKYVYLLCLLGFLIYIYIVPFVQNVIAMVRYRI